jgi:hypothetical protein
MQEESIDPGHDPRRRFPQRLRLLLERGARQAKKHIVPADAEFWVVAIEGLSSLRVSELLRLVFQPLQLHLLPPELLEKFRLLGLSLTFLLGLFAPGE